MGIEWRSRAVAWIAGDPPAPDVDAKSSIGLRGSDAYLLSAATGNGT